MFVSNLSLWSTSVDTLLVQNRQQIKHTSVSNECIFIIRLLFISISLTSNKILNTKFDVKTLLCYRCWWTKSYGQNYTNFWAVWKKYGFQKIIFRNPWHHFERGFLILLFPILRATSVPLGKGTKFALHHGKISTTKRRAMQIFHISTFQFTFKCGCNNFVSKYTDINSLHVTQIDLLHNNTFRSTNSFISDVKKDLCM